MLLPFIDRDKEKAKLKRIFLSKESTFCCLYGRRRSGKSRLIREVLLRKNSVYYVSDEREPALQRKALASSAAAVLPGFDGAEYPDWASLLDRWWRESPSGSLLILDEFPYLVKASPELPSILQRLLDQNRARRLHLVICGSSQSMMQGLVLDASSPLYGRAQEIISLRPLEASWIARALHLKSPADILEAYSMWGGIPRYWELAADYADPWKAMEDLVLDPMGVLHNEPRRLLMDDMRETAQAGSMLALVGGGCNRLSEIAARLGKPATSLTRPMQRLMDLGFVRRDVPFGAAPKSSKKTLYRIDDPFLSFWFRYVERNRSRLEIGMAKTVMQEIRKDFHRHSGEVWENLVRLALPRLRVERIDWMPACRWWGPGNDKKPLELDVVSESADRRVLFVGEAKRVSDERNLPELRRALEQKVGRLPFASSYNRIVTAVFVVEARGKAKGKNVITGSQVLSVLR
jgi:hypothetical protein